LTGVKESLALSAESYSMKSLPLIDLTQEKLLSLAKETQFAPNGIPHPLKSGDALYMPPHLPHAVKATEQFSMLLTLFRAIEPAAPLTQVNAASVVAN
jgi:hypothetical protein